MPDLTRLIIKLKGDNGEVVVESDGVYDHEHVRSSYIDQAIKAYKALSGDINS